MAHEIWVDINLTIVLSNSLGPDTNRCPRTLCDYTCIPYLRYVGGSRRYVKVARDDPVAPKWRSSATMEIVHSVLAVDATIRQCLTKITLALGGVHVKADEKCK